jgi:hypothetical protein
MGLLHQLHLSSDRCEFVVVVSQWGRWLSCITRARSEAWWDPANERLYNCTCGRP